MAEGGAVRRATTLAELKAAGEKLQQSGGADFSGLYFPGRYQYAALPFLYDTGGVIATRNGEKWAGALSSPQAQAGLTNWADLVKAVSKAPADTDETNLPDVLAQAGPA